MPYSPKRALLILLPLLLLAGCSPMSPRGQWVMAGDSYAATGEAVLACAAQGKVSPAEARELLLLDEAAAAALAEWDRALDAGAGTVEIRNRMLVLLDQYIVRRLAIEKRKYTGPTTRRTP